MSGLPALATLRHLPEQKIDEMVAKALAPRIDYCSSDGMMVGSRRALFVTELRHGKLWPVSERRRA